jgi:hypothetical protein
MALYPSLFGYIEGPLAGQRLPTERPQDIRVVRIRRVIDPSRRTR